MAYFPNQIMPKTLMKETSKEVDDSPAIENAKDWNTQHREIRAIEKFLIGTRDPNSLVFAGKSQTGTIQYPKSLYEAKAYVRHVLEDLFNGCGMSQFNGTVRCKNYIQLPDCLIKTKTVGDISISDTTITVESTKGFPLSGTITKINGLRTDTYCQSGVYSSPVGAGSICATGTKYISYSDFTGSVKHRTSQEIITYTSKTENEFLGCTRSINDSTAEGIIGEQAVILSGNASLSISHNFWSEKQNSDPHACEVYVSVTPDLYVDGGVLKRGTNQVINPIEEFVESSYILTVISDFQDINFSQIIGISPVERPISYPVGPGTPVTPPMILQSGFFRLDTMNIHTLGWHFYYEHTGIVVMPLYWIEGTSKKVQYCQYDSTGSRYAVLPRRSGQTVIPLINSEITPTYSRFHNRDKSQDWTVGCSNATYYCGVFHAVELIFNNYRTYGSLTVADVTFRAAGTAYYFNLFTQFYSPLVRSPNIIGELSITEGSSISSKSSFNFSMQQYGYYYYRANVPVLVTTKSNNVSYIIPNNSVSGWENYFNI